jgi:hypothetical protein
MSTTTRIAAAQDGLFALLQARPGLAGVQLVLGTPADLRPEAVWIAEESRSEQSFAATTGQAEDREEQIELTVHAVASRGDLELVPVRDRAIALAAEVEAAVRADRTLSGSVWDAEVTGLEISGGIDGDRRIVDVQVQVRARAWLS